MSKKIILILFFVFIYSNCFAIEIAALLQKAQKGDVEAKAEIAELYFDEASPYYKHKSIENVSSEYLFDSAYKGSAIGQYQLGRLMEAMNPVSVDKDNEQSNPVFWFAKSAEQGYPDAYAKLGSAYIEGTYVPINKKKGFELIQKSVELNSKVGTFFLAIHNLTGLMVEKNIDKYIEYLKISADLGNRNALYFLGLEYQRGEYVERNIQKSVQYFKKSALQNHEKAMAKLGTIYYYGFNEIAADKTKGAFYIIKAAELCDFQSMEMAGLIFDSGDGVPANYIKAYAWYSVTYALDQNKKHIKELLDLITQELNQQDVIKGQEIAKEQFDKCNFYRG